MRKLLTSLGAVVMALALSAAELPAATKHIIIVDPGHGGSADSGSQGKRSLSASNNAASPGGLEEKDLTLQLSLEIQRQVALLAKDHPAVEIECVLTRKSDTNPDFIERAAACAAVKPLPTAIFSVHFNASDSHTAIGTETMVHNKGVNQNFAADTEFASGLSKAAHAAVAKFVEGTKLRGNIADSHLHNGAGSNYFYQLTQLKTLAAVPKCFLEVEFIDRADVEKQLLNPREKTFPVIAHAIANYLYAYCESK